MKQETDMENMLLSASYDVVRQQMETQSFWLKLFIRPCCPRPNAHAAHLKVQALRDMMRQREDFSEAQHEELSNIMDKYEEWYVKHVAGAQMSA